MDLPLLCSDVLSTEMHHSASTHVVVRQATFSAYQNFASSAVARSSGAAKYSQKANERLISNNCEIYQ